jgi:hypothetical protein
MLVIWTPLDTLMRGSVADFPHCALLFASPQGLWDLEKHPEQFGSKQHSIVQRLLQRLRKKAAEKLIAHELLGRATNVAASPGSVDGSGYIGSDPPTAPPVERASKAGRLNRSVEVGASASTAPPG